MTMSETAHGARAVLDLELDSDDRFAVREYHVEEGLSALFSVKLTVHAKHTAIDFEETIGQGATFRVGGGTASPCWSGVVSEIHELCAEESGSAAYHLTIVPRLQRLTQRTACRVFEQRTDLEVARVVLEEWGLPYREEATRVAPARRFRVQYHESDYAFLCRLLEAAGISFFHRHSERGSILMLTDAPERGDRRVAPLEHADGPCGARFAARFRATQAGRSQRFAFESNALDLGVGKLLRVTGHPTAERAGELLVTRVRVSGVEGASPSVVCLAESADRPHRPEVATPAPAVDGVEYATVVGLPSCDELGQVRVSFHWDAFGAHGEQSTCWVPVNRGWADDLLGDGDLPRVGQEVIVAFLAGDPEDPIIVGRMFTGPRRPVFPRRREHGGPGLAAGRSGLLFDDDGPGLRFTRPELDSAWSGAQASRRA